MLADEYKKKKNQPFEDFFSSFLPKPTQQRASVRSQLFSLQPRMMSALEKFFSCPTVYNTLLIEGCDSDDALRYLSWTLIASQFEGLSKHINLDGESAPGPMCAYQSIFKKNFSYEEILPPRAALFTSSAESEHEWIGRIYEDIDGPFLRFGLFQRARGGVLLLPVRRLLESKTLAKALCQILATGMEHWGMLTELHTHKGLPALAFPKLVLPLRVILVGHGPDFDALGGAYSYWKHAPRAFMAPWIAVKRKQQQIWLEHVQQYLEEQVSQKLFFPLDLQRYLLWKGARLSGAQNRLPLTVPVLVRPLKEAVIKNLNTFPLLEGRRMVPSNLVQKFFRKKDFLTNFWKKEEQRACLKGAAALPLHGMRIGQVVALAVSDYGHEQIGALPFRFTCVRYASSSDAELIDIDGKLGLGGTIYLKGIAILEAYLRSFLKIPANFPFSFSFVSEQVYDHFDGDSATVAAFCGLVSLLTGWPIKQFLAVTGSMDQLGHVTAVGGINEKIEGFSELTQATLSGKVSHVPGVIFPQKNLEELVLDPQIYKRIEQGSFALYPVKDVWQALEHLLGRSEPEIMDRLQEVFPEEKEDPVDGSYWKRFLHFFGVKH